MTKYTARAKPGDTALCVNGHELYVIRSEIAPGLTLSASDFEPVGDAIRPISGQQIQRCHVCSAPWVTQGVGGGFVLCNVRQKVET